MHTHLYFLFCFLLFAATYPEFKLVQIWSCSSPGYAPILPPSSVQTSLLGKSSTLGRVRARGQESSPPGSSHLWKVNHWIKGFLRDYFSMDILFIWSLPVLPHGLCFFLTLVLTQGQGDKARCVGRSSGDPHTVGFWSSNCQGGHSSSHMPGMGYHLG